MFVYRADPKSPTAAAPVRKHSKLRLRHASDKFRLLCPCKLEATKKKRRNLVNITPKPSAGPFSTQPPNALH